MSFITPTALPSGYAETDLERLRSSRALTPDQQKARLRKVAEEFESLFMYQMLKAMRQTVGDNPLTKDMPMASGMGKDTFMDMFDVHLARRMVNGREGSIADILYAQLVKTIDVPEEPAPVKFKPFEKDEQRGPIEIERPDLPVEQPGRRPLPLDTQRSRPVPIRTAASNGRPQSSIRERYGAIIDEAAAAHKVDSALIEAVIQNESAGNARAVSGAGAKGLMQLMDSTAAELGVKRVFDERENIMSGTRYLRRMIDRFGDVRLALAAYNAGPGTVERYGNVPPYRETQHYVEKVLASAAANGMQTEAAPLKPEPDGADK
jgi:Rod binding domain-containing protein